MAIDTTEQKDQPESGVGLGLLKGLSVAGLQMALDLLADDNPKAKVAKLDDFIDNRFIKELDDSGYIDSLYKAKPR